jgi:hypothetical protein
MVTHQWGGAFSLPIGNDSGQRRVGNPIARQAETKAEKLAAPSWSWMSVPTPVRFRVSGISFTLEIVDVQMQPSIEAAQFGNVDFGVLTVRGPVKPILADIGLDMPSTGSYGSTSTSPLLLKLGELDDTESNSSKKALCLELQKKNENIWIRTGLSESSDAGWLEARIVTIV